MRMTMNQQFSPAELPSDSVFLACSSHEDRCLGIVEKWGARPPKKALLFHYDDPNPRREKNHEVLQGALGALCKVAEIPFTETNAVSSFHSQHESLWTIIRESAGHPVVVDISVFTKRHLLM